MSDVGKTGGPPQQPAHAREETGQKAQGLWRLLTRFDAGAVHIEMAARNTLGLLVVLGVSSALHSPRASFAAAGGAIAASFSDGTEAYRERARQMLVASVMVSLAMATGVVSGATDWLAIGVAAAAAFGAGLAVSVSQRTGDLGVISLVWLLMYAGQDVPPARALTVTPLALAGGLVQAGLSLVAWPFQPYAPERRALSELFAALARVAKGTAEPGEPPPASAVISRAAAVLRELRHDSTLAAVRYRAILGQAECIRLGLIALDEFRRRIEAGSESPAVVGSLREFLQQASAALQAIGQLLQAGAQAPEAQAPEAQAAEVQAAEVQAALARLDVIAAECRQRLEGAAPSFAVAVRKDALFQMDALAGQIRAVRDLAVGTTPAGAAAFAQAESRRPWRLRLGGAWATLRANLDRHSVAFRHAVRLSLCVAVGDALARGLHLERGYWIPMTVAIVLKPDFAATMSRGGLRIAGELAGLLLATGLFHLLPDTKIAELALVGAFMFLLRSLGPANFGVFSLAVSALVVLLFTLRGVIPGHVIIDRGRSMLLGGTLALMAYIVWPTWERYHVREPLAQFLRALRDYFGAVVARAKDPEAVSRSALDGPRAQARLARSNLEASIQRWAAEPGTRPPRAQPGAWNDGERATPGACDAVTGCRPGDHRPHPGSSGVFALRQERGDRARHLGQRDRRGDARATKAAGPAGGCAAPIPLRRSRRGALRAGQRAG